MELWPYQKSAIDFIKKNKKVYLAMGLGTGKTLTSLAGALEISKKNILVIAELNEIQNSQNFKKEVDNYFPGTWGYCSLRETNFSYSNDVYEHLVCGINPDGLAKLDMDTIGNDFDVVIMDEATMAKTMTTARFKRIRKVCEVVDYLILLSGTPLMNGAAELYAPLLLMGHKLAGGGTAKDREAFEAIFAGGHRRKIKNSGVYWRDYIWWAKGCNHVRELRHLVSDAFFFMTKEETGVFNKKKSREVIEVTMTLDWLVEYNQAWEKYLIEANLRDVDMENVKELQGLIENGQCYQVNSKRKVKYVVDDIVRGKYGKQRILIFSLFIETEELLKETLAKNGVAFKTFEELNEWKKGDEQVLLGRIKAHAKGGNVSDASVVLFVDMDWVPANNIQAENRIDRPEQKNPMTVRYYLTEGKDVVDAHVRNIVRQKTSKIDNFMKPLTPEEAILMPSMVRGLKEKYPKEFRKLGYPQV